MVTYIMRVATASVISTYCLMLRFVHGEEPFQERADFLSIQPHLRSNLVRNGVAMANHCLQLQSSTDTPNFELF